MNTYSILLFGLLLGMQHATEADHLAAMATLSSGKNSLKQTMKQGMAWGVGHTLTLLLIGGIALWLGSSIPARMAQSLEMAVAIMLVVLGADVLRRLAQQQVHVHAHHHEGQKHLHAHSHLGDVPGSNTPHRHAHPDHPPRRALLIGMMHGVAGSAALIALSLSNVSSWAMGLLYIAIFGLGSIVGMSLLSVVITLPLRWSANSLGWFHNGMTACVGLFSCALGGIIFYQIGFVEGLLLG
jgi:sulfite exporter TauE/SafE